MGVSGPATDACCTTALHADPSGKPWDSTRGKSGGAKTDRSVGNDVARRFKVDRIQGYMGPFIMNPEVWANLGPARAFADGPFPALRNRWKALSLIFAPNQSISELRSSVDLTSRHTRKGSTSSHYHAKPSTTNTGPRTSLNVELARTIR